MLSHLGCTLAAALLICTQPATAEVATARGTIVRALFLGDNGHHKPAERFKELQSALARRGIELNYTDQLADLNTNTLAKYVNLLSLIIVVGGVVPDTAWSSQSGTW